MLVGKGLIGQLGSLLDELVGAHRYAVITDSSVADSHARRVREQISRSSPCSMFVFPSGEQAKTRETWGYLTDRMLADGVGRDSAVVAVGGGVVGDMAGFVAATFMRGIPLVHVPTTLLAMVDSSIGGKTGVDSPTGKNMVGAFHQPSLVVSDLDTLATLPPAEIRNGLVEALKHGAIADAGYFEEVASWESGNLARVVERSVEIKGVVVTGDELEGGRRAILNFGHTVGHALECATDFAIPHGNAVGIGMVLEGLIGRDLGISVDDTPELIAGALVKLGLPTTVPPTVPTARLVALLGSDKKNREGSVRCSLLKQIGEPARASDGEWTHPVSEVVLNRCFNQ